MRGYLVLRLWMEAHLRNHPACPSVGWVPSYEFYSDIRCLNGLCRYHSLLGLLRQEIRQEASTGVTALPDIS